MNRHKAKRVSVTDDPGILFEFETETEAQSFYEGGQGSRRVYEQRGNAVLFRTDVVKPMPEKEIAPYIAKGKKLLEEQL